MHIALDVDGERFGLDEVLLRDIVRWLDGVGAGDALKRILEHSKEDKGGSGYSPESLLGSRDGLPEMKPLFDLMISNYKVLEELYASTSIRNRFPWEKTFPTGVEELDALTGGMQKGEVTLLAGSRESGVSELLFGAAAGMSMILNADGKAPRVAVFSSARVEEDVSMRMLAIRSGISFEQMRMGGFSSESWSQLAQAVGELAEAPLWVIHDATLSADSLRQRCGQLDAGGKAIDVLVLDRIELQRHMNPEMLHKLADELDVSVLVSAWLPVQLACTPKSAIQEFSPTLLDSVDTAFFLEQDGEQPVLHMVKHNLYPPASTKLTHHGHA
jgi:hypothetical protein